MGIMDGIAGCITPIIPMMIGGGMIKVFACEYGRNLA